MEENEAITVLSALAQPTRLRCVRHLVRHGASTAGDLATALDVPQNTMSVHLAILTRAGLLTSRKEGRHMIYERVPGAVAHLRAFLEEVATPE